MIIAPTKKVEKTLREYEMEQDITVIPSGIEIQKFMEKENNIVSKAIREKYGIEEEKKVILSLGRLGFEKRIEELLFGMQELLKTRKEVILMIVEGGPAEISSRKQQGSLEFKDPCGLQEWFYRRKRKTTIRWQIFLHVLPQARHRDLLILKRWQAVFLLSAGKTIVWMVCWKREKMDLLMRHWKNLRQGL